MIRSVLSSALLVLLVLIGLQACDKRGETGPPWLVGEWRLSYNPLNDDADVLEFRPNNKVSIQTVDGRKLTGHYLIRENHLLLLIEKGARSIETEFIISSEKGRLTYKNGAFYTRTDKTNGIGSVVDDKS